MVFALFFLEWQTETWLWDFLLENKFSSSYLFLVSIYTLLTSFPEGVVFEGRGHVSVTFLSLAPAQVMAQNKHIIKTDQVNE